MGQAIEVVSKWPEHKREDALRRLIISARHGIKTSVPNLATIEQAEDMELLLSALEEEIRESNETGLEHLPDMPQDHVDAPDSPPVDEPTVSTEGEQTSETGV